MRRVRFLQIGDIHYPEWTTVYSDVDAKDIHLSPSIVSELRRPAFRSVLTKLNQFSRNKDMDCVVFMGDFTTRGLVEHLEPAFLHFTLLMNGITDHRKLAAVPGNHDVNRQEAYSLGSIEKFARLQNLAEKYGWQHVPTNEPISFSVGNSGADCKFVLLNTAVGSWELQNLPKLLRDKLQSSKEMDPPLDLGVLAEDGGRAAVPTQPAQPRDDADLLSQYYDQLDTPYASSDMLTSAIESINDSSTPFAVLVAHHNLLPQKTPRLSPYAELLNGGFVRRQLISTNKPVIFLHGHIHQDPIEVISDPYYPNGKIISISAPDIAQGFNEIVLFLTEQNELVGVRVVPYRVSQSDGTVRPGDHCFVPALPPARVFIDESAISLLKKLRNYCTERSEDLLYWAKVSQLCHDDNPLSTETLEDMLLLMHASQLIEIDGLSKPHRDWRIAVRN